MGPSLPLHRPGYDGAHVAADRALTVSSGLARRLWMTLEACHASVYFEPTAKDIYGAAGLKGYWMGYFASRAAALGPVPPEVVIATFYNFEPGKVRRAIPDAWKLAPPERVIAARFEVADVALSKTDPDVDEAADLATTIARGADVTGRPLAAAHLALTPPESPRLHLWWAATVLREHRGDGHVAVLVSEGLSGLDAHVLKHAAGEVPGPEQMKLSRGWSEEQWSEARERLERRGLVDAGGLTDSGLRLRDHIETRTDGLARQPYEAAGRDRSERLLALVTPLAREIVSRGDIPYPNPMGLPRQD